MKVYFYIVSDQYCLFPLVYPHVTGNPVATTTTTPPRANISVVNVRARGVLLQWNAVGGAMGGEGDDATRTELLIRPLVTSKQQHAAAAQYHRLLLSTAPAPTQAHTVHVEVGGTEQIKLSLVSWDCAD